MNNNPHQLEYFDILPEHLKSFNPNFNVLFNQQEPKKIVFTKNKLERAIDSELLYGYELPEGTNYVELDGDYHEVYGLICFNLVKTDNPNYEAEYAVWQDAKVKHNIEVDIFKKNQKEYKSFCDSQRSKRERDEYGNKIKKMLSEKEHLSSLDKNDMSTSMLGRLSYLENFFAKKNGKKSDDAVKNALSKLSEEDKKVLGLI